MDASTSAARLSTERALPAAEGPAAPRDSVAAIAASLLLHGLVAAAALGLVTAPILPEPIVVELVADPGGGGVQAGAGDDAAGKGAGMETPAAADAERNADRPADPPRPEPAAVAAPEPPRPAPRAQRPTKAQPAKRAEQRRQEPLPAEVSEAAKPDVTPAEMPAAAPDNRASAASASAESAGGNAVAAGAGGAAGGGGQAGGGGGGGSSGPGYRLGSAANPMPAYPLSARRAGIEGEVVLRVTVSADGQARAVEIARSSGSAALDAAARKAIARWRFRPAQRAGVAVEGTATIPVRFTLRDG